MDLLLFFALPVATIILSIVAQKILKNPLLVAATTFAIFLIVTYAVFDSSFLIFTIVYTILSYIAAYLTKFICESLGKNGIFNNIRAENITTNNLTANQLDVNDENNNGCCTNRLSRGYYRNFR